MTCRVVRKAPSASSYMHASMRDLHTCILWIRVFGPPPPLTPAAFPIVAIYTDLAQQQRRTPAATEFNPFPPAATSTVCTSPSIFSPNGQPEYMAT